MDQLENNEVTDVGLCTEILTEVVVESNKPDEIIDESSALNGGSCCVGTQTFKIPLISAYDCKNDPKQTHFYTGLQNLKKFHFIFKSLGSCSCELKYFYGPPAHVPIIPHDPNHFKTT